ncbi:MAG TPA: Holliday junction branch migration protein RuvA [Aggregatilineaceae bacterium]|nr:Holliday junction branch migration protein RuvA [Aggregatilineaceae bacterium]
MIDIISGPVAASGKDYVVVMVGGIGLHISVPKSVFDHLDGHTLTLYTHLVVREDALTLFGFAEPEERTMFDLLLTVSGVGPRIALAVLSTLTVEHLKNAVAREEPEILTRVPGVGKKLAQKVVFELKDKLALDTITGLAAISDLDTDVLATLTALGYSVVEAQAALQSIPRDAPQDIEERVRLALNYFA